MTGHVKSNDAKDKASSDKPARRSDGTLALQRDDDTGLLALRDKLGNRGFQAFLRGAAAPRDDPLPAYARLRAGRSSAFGVSFDDGGSHLGNPATSITAPLQTAAFNPLQTAGANLILQRKCACGAGASSLTGECAECGKKKLRLQTKLRINEPGDAYEQEADRVAEQMLAKPAHPDVSSAPPRIQRFSGPSSGQVGDAPASVDRVLASPGRPLDPALRQDMEQRFGHDFSRVRVHSGGAAEQSARDVNANAYTVNHNIVFGVGRFAPQTNDGRLLLAHELTHVVQQSGNGLRLQIQRQFAGCQNLIPAPPQGVGVGIAVHKAIETHFRGSVTGVPSDQVRIPGASAAPGRTQGLCGRDEDLIKPQVLGGKAGGGLPDLARVGTGGVLQVAEIKPATEPCLIDGETQLSRYIVQGNERDAQQVAWRNSLGIKVVSPILASAYPSPTLPFGRCRIQTAWCTAGLLGYAVSCTPRQEPEEQPQHPLNLPLLIGTGLLVTTAAITAAFARPRVTAPKPTVRPAVPVATPKPGGTVTPIRQPKPFTPSRPATAHHRPSTGARSGGGAGRVAGGIGLAAGLAFTIYEVYSLLSAFDDAKQQIAALDAYREQYWKEIEAALAQHKQTAADVPPTQVVTAPPVQPVKQPDPEPPKPVEKKVKIRVYRLSRALKLTESEIEVPSSALGVLYEPVSFLTLTPPGKATTAIDSTQVDCSKVGAGAGVASGWQQLTGYADLYDVARLKGVLGDQLTLIRAMCYLSGQTQEPAAQPDSDEVAAVVTMSDATVTATCRKVGAASFSCDKDGDFASLKAATEDEESNEKFEFTLEVNLVRVRGGKSQRFDRSVTAWLENPDHPAPEPHVKTEGSIPSDAVDWERYPADSALAYILRNYYSSWGGS